MNEKLKDWIDATLAERDAKISEEQAKKQAEVNAQIEWRKDAIMRLLTEWGVPINFAEFSSEGHLILRGTHDYAVQLHYTAPDREHDYPSLYVYGHAGNYISNAIELALLLREYLISG